MYVGLVDAPASTIVINVQVDEWDLGGIAIVQVAVSDGHDVEITTTDKTIQITIKVDSISRNTSNQLHDLGIYLIDQATE